MSIFFLDLYRQYHLSLPIAMSRAQNQHHLQTDFSHNMRSSKRNIFFGEDEIEICLTFYEFVYTIKSFSSRHHELCTESAPPAHRFLTQYAFLGSQYISREMRLISVCPFTNLCRQSHLSHVALICVQNRHIPSVHRFLTQYAILVTKYFLFVEDESENCLTFSDLV